MTKNLSAQAVQKWHILFKFHCRTLKIVSGRVLSDSHTVTQTNRADQITYLKMSSNNIFYLAYKILEATSGHEYLNYAIVYALQRCNLKNMHVSSWSHLRIHLRAPMAPASTPNMDIRCLPSGLFQWDQSDRHSKGNKTTLPMVIKINIKCKGT